VAMPSFIFPKISLLIEVPVPKQERERSFICVLGVLILNLFLCLRNLKMFKQCGILD
jgi:hypothetical protein